ncbi:MAG: hypothetical protein H6728_06210 [Myxococcales bacterium]|nr:hypothetical protein [Myxococcales bacterium]
MKDWSHIEKRWVGALFGAMIPAHPHKKLPSLQEIETSSFWERFDRVAPTQLRLGLRLGVWIFTWLPIFLPRFRRRFHRMSPDKQTRFLYAMANSRSFVLRQIASTLKLFACLAYLQDPNVRDQVTRLADQTIPSEKISVKLATKTTG